MEIKKIVHEELKLVPTVQKDKREFSQYTTCVRRKEPAGVYAIINLVNGKFYIGSSIGMNTRWWNHLVDLRNGTHENTHLQNSFNKYGEENFIFQIIEEVNFDESDKVASVKLVRKVEQIYLDYYQPFNKEIGYNLNKKANGGKRQNTFEDIANGKAVFTLEQFNKAIDLLCNTTKSFGEISQETGITKSTIKGFFYKTVMPDFMKSFNFLPRTKSKKLENIIQDQNKLQEFKELVISSSRQKILRSKYDCDNITLKNWCNILGLDVTIELESDYTEQKTVYQYDLLGNLINTYKSVREAAKKLNFNADAIRAACAGRQKIANGYFWLYENRKFPKPTYLDLLMGQYFNLDKKLHPILQYDANHKPVVFYNKLEEIRSNGFLLGEIQKNCTGKIKCYKGYYFRYADEVPEEDLKYLWEQKQAQNNQ